MQTETSLISDFFGEQIYSYSRADAISDGVLVPVSDTLLGDAGIKFPMCLTDTVWSGYIDPANISKLPGQSVDGRLWDLLWLFRLAIKSSTGSNDRIRFQVLFLQELNKHPEMVDLIAVCGPGDQGEPVITIMVPGED